MIEYSWFITMYGCFVAHNKLNIIFPCDNLAKNCLFKNFFLFYVYIIYFNFPACQIFYLFYFIFC